MNRRQFFTSCAAVGLAAWAGPLWSVLETGGELEQLVRYIRGLRANGQCPEFIELPKDVFGAVCDQIPQVAMFQNFGSASRGFQNVLVFGVEIRPV